MHKILLIGIGGVYNYGCEAIVRGTEAILHKRWPDLKIYYASSRPDDDKKRLKGCDVKIIYRKRMGRYSFVNISRKFLEIFKICYLPTYESKSILKDFDAVFSIGGDIYTLYSNNKFNYSLPRFGDFVKKKHIPYILWGASVGPFDMNHKIETFFSKHLKNVSLITAREAETIEYLKTLNIHENVVRCADPAFLVATEKNLLPKHNKNRKKIGINLSPLSSKYSSDKIGNIVRRQAIMVEKIIKEFDCDVLLLPHVFCDFNESDDDYRYLKNIYNHVKASCGSKVDIVENDPGYIGLKDHLMECDLIIAARMHCAINAITCNLPTVLLAYSAKAKGMGKYVYGNNNYVSNIEEFSNDTFIVKISEILNDLESIRNTITQRLPLIQEECLSPIPRLNNIFE